MSITRLTKTEKGALNEFKARTIKFFPDKLKSIILFGSKARNTSIPFSDIDILVVVEEETISIWDQIQEISSDISIKYDILLSVKVVDIHHLDYLKKVDSGFIKNIYKEGINIWKAA